MLELIYFARVAELTGSRGESWPLDGLRTGADLIAALRDRYPALAQATRLELAVNQYRAAPGVTLKDGDEVAVFEPVTGG